MSKKIFSDKEIKDLSKNKYVKNVTEKGITYTNEFKLLSVAEYEIGKSYRDKSVIGLEGTSTLKSGRILNHELTMKEILAKKNAEIEYLKAELELVKKLEVS